MPVPSLRTDQAHEHLVLVVDDEPASVRAVRRALVDEARVVTACDGVAAWATLQRETVALVVADQRMPGMLGTELFARTAARYPQVVRVLLTGYTDSDTLLNAINAGHVFYYVTKPWTAGELRLVVRRGLERYDAMLERQRLCTELEYACGQLRREVTLKDRLLTLAAHELGTPLHLVGSALEMLEGSALGCSERDWLAMAQRNVSWLARGLSQMLTAGRWREQTLPLRRVATDLRRLLEAVRRRFEKLDEVRHLTLGWEIPTGLPLVMIDPEWMERALANLVSNAVRSTPDGGWIRIAAEAVDGKARVHVGDSGIGIPAAVLNEIFEPFSGASGDLLRHGSGQFEFGARGLGLGLATAKAIVDQHGGRLEVASHEGQGSCFTIMLPSAEADVVA